MAAVTDASCIAKPVQITRIASYNSTDEAYRKISARDLRNLVATQLES